MRMRGNPQTLKLGPQSHLDLIVSPRHLSSWRISPTKMPAPSGLARRRWLEASPARHSERGAAGSSTRNRGPWKCAEWGSPDVRGRGDDGRKKSAAADVVATNSNGISALKLQAKPGEDGVAHKLRRSTVVSKREPLGGKFRLMRSPTEPRSPPFRQDPSSPGRWNALKGGPGRIRLSAKFTNGLCRPYQGKPVPCSSDLIPCSVE